MPRRHPTTPALRHRPLRFLAPLLAFSLAVQAAAEPDRHSLAEGKITLALPDAAWQLRTDDQQPPPTIATIEIDEGSRARIGLQAVPGVTFDTLVPMLESAFESQYQDYQKLDAGTHSVAGQQVFRASGTYSEDGETWHSLGVFTLTEEAQLFSLTVRVRPADLKSLEPSLDSLFAGIEVDGRPVASATAPDR